MISHSVALALAREAGADGTFGRLVAAVAYHESRYGAAAYRVPLDLVDVPCTPGARRGYGSAKPPTVPRVIPGALGAIQATATWAGPCAWALDSSPRPDGTTYWYAHAYRSYTDPVEAWRGLVRMLGDSRPSVRTAAMGGRWHDAVVAMRATGYYEGFGASQAARIAGYWAGVARGLYLAGCEIGEIQRMATLRVGSRGDDVREWQCIVGAYPDGAYGPHTDAATRAWQRSQYVVDDGVVGLTSWSVALMREAHP